MVTKRMVSTYTYKDIELLRTMAREKLFLSFAYDLDFRSNKYPEHLWDFLKDFFHFIIRPLRRILGKSLSKYDVAIFRKTLVINPHIMVNPIPEVVLGKFVHLIFEVPEEDLFTQIGLGSLLEQQIKSHVGFISRLGEFWDLLVKWRYAIGK